MWNSEGSNVKFVVKRSSGTQLGQRNKAGHTKIRHWLTSLKLEQLTTKILKQNFNSHKRVELWAKSIKDFWNFGRYFPCATSAKIEESSHIMGPTPILEISRAYGLRPRLWLLVLDWPVVYPTNKSWFWSSNHSSLTGSSGMHHS